MRLIFLCFLIVLPAWAHQTSVTSEGNSLYWANKNIPLYIRTNTSDLPSTTARNIILDSMAQWNGASTAKLTSVSSSANQILFSSDFSIYGSAVIGLTEISYNSSGAIQTAVIRLNDDYHFGDNQNSYADNSIYLGDVVTHELGHLFGLSHSEVLTSSMFYTSFPGQSSLSPDDKSGIRQKYGSSAGQIMGSVRGGKDIGVLGVHVQAISRKSGESIGVISDEDGNFTIAGLDLNDSYYLYTSPIKNLDSIPGYYSNVQTSFCPASYVGSFFSACGRDSDGLPQPISLVSGNETVDVGVVTINCSLRANEDYSFQKIQTSFSPVTIWDSSDSERRETAFVGYFSKRNDTTWSDWETLAADLSGVQVSYAGHRYVQLSLLAHALGSALEYELQIYRNGILVAEQGISESLLLGTYNTDISVTLPLDTNGSENVFDLKVRARSLSNSVLPLTFPSSSQFSSKTHMPHLVVIGVLDNGLQPLFNSQQILSDNASCLDAPFTFKVSNARVSNGSHMSADGVETGAVGAACGTIGPPDDGPGSSLGLLVTGFVFSSLLGLIAKKSKNILS